MRLALALLLVAGCPSPPAPAAGTSSDTAQAPAPSGTTVAPQTATSVEQPDASANPAQVASARAGVTESDAATLVALGGTYLCDQRVYPQPPAPHLSAWEWAFSDEPAVLAYKLGKQLPGSKREGMTFRYLEGDKVQVVVSVHPVGKSQLRCAKEPPAGSKSLVVASRS